MTLKPEQVKEAAEYLENGGLGEVMHGLQLSAVNGFSSASGDIAMLMALCAMAANHMASRDEQIKQPVRMKFGRPQFRRM